MEATVEIPFLTAIFGGTEKLRTRRLEECTACKGSGRKAGVSSNGVCKTCNGQGSVQNLQRTPFGVISSSEECRACHGTGENSADQCHSCKGQGTTMESKEVTIRIPKGVNDGATLRVRGNGNAGRKGGARGDLFVHITVKEHPKFTRDGADIHSEEEISYVEAILGVTIRAATIDGHVDVKIPPGTQPEQKLRLKGKGAHKLNSESRGDAFIKIKVKIPKTLRAKERELVDQIASLRTINATENTL
jgi:molecular chaperone DnaJ